MPARRITVNGRDRIDPRHTRAWRKLRDQVVREEPLCTLRIRGVCTHRSTTADHVEPVSLRPELAMVRSNLRGSCAPCNDARRSLPDGAFARGPADDEGDRPALAIFATHTDEKNPRGG